MAHSFINCLLFGVLTNFFLRLNYTEYAAEHKCYHEVSKQTRMNQKDHGGRFMRQTTMAVYSRQNEKKGKVTPCTFPQELNIVLFEFVGSVAGGSILS